MISIMQNEENIVMIVDFRFIETYSVYEYLNSLSLLVRDKLRRELCSVTISDGTPILHTSCRKRLVS